MSNHNIVLVIAAHPDDEVLGCGATIVKHVQAGDLVHILIIGDGLESREKTKESVHKNTLNSSRILGASSFEILGYPACRFYEKGLLAVTKEIEKKINLLKPDIIYLHHFGDMHMDHQAVYEASLPALRPVAGFSVKRILCYEVPSATDWVPPIQDGRIFKPTVFINIEKTFLTKIKALECYKDEMRPFPHPRSPEALKVYAQRWGIISGCQMAEAFELMREIT